MLGDFPRQPNYLPIVTYSKENIAAFSIGESDDGLFPLVLVIALLPLELDGSSLPRLDQTDNFLARLLIIEHHVRMPGNKRIVSAPSIVVEVIQPGVAFE